MKFFLNNSYEHVGGDGAPDLRLDRVLAVTQKLLDAQVLLDPFEKQFHLPAAFVQSGNGQGRQGRVVGQEDQGLFGCRVLESNAPQVFGVVLGNIVPVQCNGLIADKDRCSCLPWPSTRAWRSCCFWRGSQRLNKINPPTSPLPIDCESTQPQSS